MNVLPNSAYAGAGEHLFLSEEFSDLTIIVESMNGCQWRFPAHKILLSAQSPVFRLMLDSDFSEKANGKVIIKDIEPHIMELMLMYIYCGKSILENWHDAQDLLCAAHKYQIDPLVNHCARFLENVISISNVCNIFNYACLYSLISLKERALKLILEAGFILLRSKSFEKLSSDAVMEIITSRELNIDSELMVFEALLRWAPIQCCRSNLPVNEENTLKELTPFLKYVCFDDMSDTEKSALPSAVLSCVKPNNRNRVTYHINDYLLNYSYFFNFQIEQGMQPCVRTETCCMRFSLDTSKYLIGLKFLAVMSNFPDRFTLVLTKECSTTSYNAVVLNLANTVWKDVTLESNRWEAKALFRQPCPIEERSVYKLYIETVSTNIVTVPKMSLINSTLSTDSGVVNMSLHSECIWGIKNLIFI